MAEMVVCRVGGFHPPFFNRLKATLVGAEHPPYILFSFSARFAAGVTLPPGQGI